MRAASLDHTYLTVESINENDVFSGGSRKHRNQHFTRLVNEENTNAPDPASHPLSRRSVPVIAEESNQPPSTTYGRSVSTPEGRCIVLGQYAPNDGRFHPIDGVHPQYSLKNFLSKRRGSGDDDEKLSQRVKRFYKKQDELINSFENIEKQASGVAGEDKKLAKQKRHIEWLIRATLVTNCTLFIAKIVAAIFSKSLSIISSVVDSASACLLFWAVRAIKKRNIYKYPGGRTRLEPVIICGCGSCNFERDACGWEDTSLGFYSWSRIQANARLATSPLAPAFDHTLNTGSGWDVIFFKIEI